MDNQALSLKAKLFPAGIAVGIWLVLHFTYDFLWMIDNVRLYQNLAAANWVLLVIIVGFGSILVYPLVYFRGASFWHRVLAVYTVPLAFCLKEFIRVNATVTTAEALFFTFFTPVQIALLLGQVGLIGVTELYCRLRMKKKGEAIRVITPAPILAILFTLTVIYFILIRGGGYDFHLMLKMIYRSLFL